ncbi:MAG: tRNA (adenosine(37)-N6)-threonylcarbamoyltransferase complex transferase subunit TsaD [Spirochaetales bacterium]|nr:tRNA (adenosine(37)-N6)-threonylcarbamoyltransferase complex transferase subunit TsaD [Spirochaetales bacterium]
MRVLGVETSCDECSVAVVEDGARILGQIIATQIDQHGPYGGVVPEIASRTHTEWISGVYTRALQEAGVAASELDGIAVTTRPGLSGSLVVGLSFAKGLAFGLGIPLIGVDHVLAHLYAPQLEQEVEYPFLGLLVSGGHTIIARVSDPFTMQVMGTTIDDACGEAFDKVAKHLNLGYPGGVAIDRLASEGDSRAFNFPDPSLHKGDHRYDVSYSGLKTAVVNQLDQFWNREFEKNNANIAASFQKAAVELLLKRLYRAAEDSGLRRVVAGGGVAANSYLRRSLAEHPELDAVYPSLELCTDNGAMVAGLAYHHLRRGDRDDLTLDVSARVAGFRKTYP